jgi:hypothetical protein
MSTIAELLQRKPSRAIRAMVEGLRTASQRNDFAVDMTTFGYVGGSYFDNLPLRIEQWERAKAHELCFGCAATCTVFALANKIADDGFCTRPLGSTIGRASLLAERFHAAVSETDVSVFEDALDDFRCGNPVTLFQYMGVTAPEGFFSTKEEYLEAVQERPMGSWDAEDDSATGWLLGTNDWEGQLPLIEAYAERLEAIGL